MDRNEQINLRLKYNRFLKFKPFFRFFPEIDSREKLSKYYDKNIEITHIDCGKKMNIKLSTWMNLHSINRKVSKEKYKYLCVHCSQMEKNVGFQNELNRINGEEFKLVGNFNGAKKNNLVRHIVCGAEFEIVPEYHRGRAITCKNCGQKSIYYEENLQKEKDLKFKNELIENGFTNFIPLEPYKSRTSIMEFNHTVCGNNFKKTPQSILKLKEKNICPKCDDNFKNACSSSQEDRNKYYQAKLDKVYGGEYKLIGDYLGSNTMIEIKHVKCGIKYFKEAQNLLKGKQTCICDKNYIIKNCEFIKLSEKIKIYEAILDNKYEIMTPFVSQNEKIKIKHKECGHIFERTVVTFLRSKGRTLCPICSKSTKLNKYKKALYEKYNDEYLITDAIPYTNYKGDLEVIHKNCDKRFISNFNLLLGKAKNHCPRCKKGRMDSSISFNQAVLNKFKGEYLILSTYVNCSTDIYFRHKKCNKKFKLNSREFMRYKIPCPECRQKNKAFSISQAQAKVDEKFGKLFRLCGIYKNMHTELPIQCNNCNTIINYTVNNILRKKGCPSCNKTYL